MRRQGKKFLSLLMAMLIAASCCVPAYAVEGEEPNKIKVTFQTPNLSGVTLAEGTVPGEISVSPGETIPYSNFSYPTGTRTVGDESEELVWLDWGYRRKDNPNQYTLIYPGTEITAGMDFSYGSKTDNDLYLYPQPVVSKSAVNTITFENVVTDPGEEESVETEINWTFYLYKEDIDGYNTAAWENKFPVSSTLAKDEIWAMDGEEVTEDSLPEFDGDATITKEYRIPLDAGTGAAVSPDSSIITKGKKVTLEMLGDLAEPVTGYSDVKWFVVPMGDVDADGTEITTNGEVEIENPDVVIVARGVPAQYKITWNAGDGQFSSGKKTSEKTWTYGTELSVPDPAPTRTGYALDGWKLNNGDVFATGTPSFTANTTITAQWTANKYGVTFNANGGKFADGSETTTVQQTYDTKWQMPADPTHKTDADQEFAGWFTDAANGTQVKSGDTFTGTQTTTVYAHWASDITKIDKVEVTLNTEGLKLNDTLPKAATTTTGVKVETTWKLGDKEVTTITEPGEYDYLIEVTTESGYKLTDATTYKLNNETVAPFPGSNPPSLVGNLTVNRPAIEEVVVTLTTTGLKTGNTLPEAETTTEGVTLTTVWKDAEGNAVSGTFSKAGNYTAEITVKAQTGYVLASNVAYKLNNANAVLENGVLTTTANVTESETPLSEISAVAVTLTTTGLKAGDSLPQADTTTEGVTVTVEWYDENDQRVSGGTFPAAGNYNYAIIVKPQEGYIWAENVSYTLNGEPVTPLPGGHDLFGPAAVGEKESTPVSAVVVTLTTAGLKAGDALPQAQTATEGVTVSTVWRDADGAVVSGTFPAAGAYSAEITVSAKNGYTLDGAAYTLNGASAAPDKGLLIAAADVAERVTPPVSQKYSVTIAPFEHGYVLVKVNGNLTDGGRYDAGSTVTIVAEPENGYALETLKINGVSQIAGGDGQYTVLLTEDITIDALFTELPQYDVTVNVTPTVGGDAYGNPAKAAAGKSITLNIVPSSGYRLDAVTFNGVVVFPVWNSGGYYTYTFTMPDVSVTIQVIFALDSYQPSIPVYPGNPGRPDSSGTSGNPAPPSTTNPGSSTEPSVPSVEPPAVPSEPEQFWSNPFTDVADNAWYYESVKYVCENGLMNGTGANSFEPETQLSRAMLARLLYNKEGMPRVSGANPFSDVAEGVWYEDAVTWAAANGLVNGYGDGLFGPEDIITREQLAAILYRYAVRCGYDVSAAASLEAYMDASSINDYAVAAMRWAVGAGLIGGVTDTTLEPQGPATRAQVAVILARFCQAIAQ